MEGPIVNTIRIVWIIVEIYAQIFRLTFVDFGCSNSFENLNFTISTAKTQKQQQTSQTMPIWTCYAHFLYPALTFSLFAKVKYKKNWTMSWYSWLLGSILVIEIYLSRLERTFNTMYLNEAYHTQWLSQDTTANKTRI